MELRCNMSVLLPILMFYSMVKESILTFTAFSISKAALPSIEIVFLKRELVIVTSRFFIITLSSLTILNMELELVIATLPSTDKLLIITVLLFMIYRR